MKNGGDAACGESRERDIHHAVKASFRTRRRSELPLGRYPWSHANTTLLAAREHHEGRGAARRIARARAGDGDPAARSSQAELRLERRLWRAGAVARLDGAGAWSEEGGDFARRGCAHSRCAADEGSAGVRGVFARVAEDSRGHHRRTRGLRAAITYRNARRSNRGSTPSMCSARRSTPNACVERMDEVLKQLDDRIRDEERQLEETKAIAQNTKDLATEPTGEKIKRVEASERANEAALQKLTDEMQDVMKDALRNKEIPEGIVADWQTDRRAARARGASADAGCRASFAAGRTAATGSRDATRRGAERNSKRRSTPCAMRRRR